MSWSAPEFAAIAALVTREFGVAFPPPRRAFAENAMRRALGIARERSLTRYRERLATEPDLLRALIAEVTVGETYFFRDPAQFDALRTIVLPELLRRRDVRDPLRTWSAGCASGEEAYSLAILLAECGLADHAHVLGTDVSSTAIDAARRGQYGAWSFRHDALGWRERCFTRTGKHWTISPAYRRVEFVVHNLMQPAPAGATARGAFDLILCRNVLLYFDRKTVERAAQVLLAALAPGGWLLTSPTDPLLPDDLGFETVATPSGLAYRKPVPAAQPARPVPVAVPAFHARPRALSVPQPQPQPQYVQAKPQPPSRRRVDAEAYVDRALAFLEGGHLHQAAAAARRALFLDRSLVVAHLTLARALRLTGSRSAAQRALRRGAALLEAHAPDAVVRGAGGAVAGTLSAIAAAEFDLLMRQTS